MQNNTIDLGFNLLSSLTNIAKTDTNIDHNYINTFSKVIDFFYKTYIGTLKSMEIVQSMKIFEEIQDILKYNIEIIEAISSDKNKRIISSLKAKRNKIMKEYINTLKRGENA
ncbi:BlyB family putative holin accessory protein [Borreliella andersonii]|uniref:BlyB family putative holin accessory protein n=1 Tax=Borrelia andersonii TaxID=42109 RepID=UPI003AB5186B